MANFKLTQTGEQIQADLNLLDSNSATSGQVLTANGTGGASWQNASGGSGGGTQLYLHEILCHGTYSSLYITYPASGQPTTTTNKMENQEIPLRVISGVSTPITELYGIIQLINNKKTVSFEINGDRFLSTVSDADTLQVLTSVDFELPSETDPNAYVGFTSYKITSFDSTSVTPL